MADIAIISASYGNYDQIKTPLKQNGVDVDWVMVTDNKELLAEQEAGLDTYGDEQWRVVYRPSTEIPMCAAKYPKTHPWEFTAATASIWIDGSVQVTSRDFAAEAMSYTWNGSEWHDIAQFKHGRQCIYDEAFASIPMPKYAGEPIQEQVDYYRETGHPEHWGLWPTTVIARQHTDLIKIMGEWWQDEMDNWSYQDQISQPYVLHNLNLRPNEWPNAIYRNPWLVVRNHRDLPADALKPILPDGKYE